MKRAMSKNMKQHEAVIKVMKKNGGFATLGFLYQNAFKVSGVAWGTKTPFASIRRIVQDDRFFFKIRPGLWALKSYKNKLPPEIFPTKEVSQAKRSFFTHSYYQGLLVEIGNLKQYQTFVPSQDKNRRYLNKKLGEITTIEDFYKFSYENIIRKARTVDVSWFNTRKMPEFLFEVEHQTDIQNSLLKFTELQDFNTQMYVVADSVREREFQSKLDLSAFEPIKKRVKFLRYNELSDWHARIYKSVALEKEIL